MPDDERPVPLEPVEHGHRVVDGLRDRERPVQRRGGEAALLVGGEANAVAQLGGQLVEVLEAQAWTAVEQENARSGSGHPAGQLAAARRDAERFAHRASLWDALGCLGTGCGSWEPVRPGARPNLLTDISRELTLERYVSYADRTSP